MPTESLQTGHLVVACLGGGVGAAFRYGVGRMGAHFSRNWPWATWFTNISGAFVLGLITGFWHKESLTLSFFFWELGVLGAYTTFSTFSLEALNLFKASRLKAALYYVAGSVLMSIFILILGYQLGALLS